jgi:hypothetical protein
MKIRTLLITVVLVLLCAAIAAPVYWFSQSETVVKKSLNSNIDSDDPDLPSGMKINKGDYLRLRDEQISYLRGWDTAGKYSRTNAIRQMEKAEHTKTAQLAPDATATPPGARQWRPLGPAPIPVNGSTSYSGRTTAIAVHPTNPNIVYAGTAQGGLYRSLDGGNNWTPLMDGALSLVIGSITISPSDPTTIWVGTGEANLCGSGCYIGVGLYKITAADTTANVSGPFNKDAANNDVFTGRAISRVVAHPTDPNTLFVATTSGIAGIGATTNGLILPNAGVYRTTNALAANPTFQQLAITGTGGSSRSVTDAVVDPLNPARMVIGLVGAGSDGGIYVSTNALDAAPAFARTLTTGDGSSLGRAELAINNVGGVTTVYAATGTANGTLYKSIDGGATFNPAGGGNGFCNGQCFYDMAIAVDPADANKVFLGGSPSLVFGRSTTGGTAFTNSATNLHVDTQAFGLAPSDTKIMYFGSDGGIWKTTDVTATPIVWRSLNNSSYLATQFESLALHPVLRNYSMGGTQDNGTQYLVPERSWIWTDNGDGGFVVIDKNATTQSDVISYHTYFNSTNSQIGFTRATSNLSNGDQGWTGFYGCGGTANGINCADATLFYAPLVGGPNAAGSTGNTLYFGTSHLYRSIDRGTTMTDVSGQLPGTNTRISAIAISSQTDDVRLVGTTAGTVFVSTTAGATTMTNITGPWASRYVGRVAIDPSSSNVAYVCLNGFGVAAGQHIWKTTNLLSATPTWLPAGGGIPDVPVNAFVADPANTQVLYAGTDIGVFQSSDGGANWQPFSVGLPRVAVFGIEIQPLHRVLRIATHGKGMWEYDLGNKKTVADFDGDGRTDLSIFRPSVAEWWYRRSFDASVRAAQFGQPGDQIVAADFTGDGRSDVGFFRPSTGQWFVLRSDDNSYFAITFGQAGDIPTPADFDGDGKADAAVFRPSTGTWFILRSSDLQTSIGQFGRAGDQPVAADYDGDGIADVAIYRPNGTSGAEWWIQRSSAGILSLQFGSPTDKAVPGDYTGDGKTDIAVFRPGDGQWFILRSEDLSYFSFFWGQAGDIPAPGDYDGDSKTEAAVFRPSNTNWYINGTTSGVQISQFGAAADQPVPNEFVR